MIASTKLDTISSHIFKALSDNKVAMKEEVTTKTKKKIATDTEESLIERERQEARESFRRLVEKNLSIPVVFPALLLTMKITIKIVSKTAIKIISQTGIKIMLKNYDCNKKEMSFLKISDPVKRDLIVKEYLELKKNIRDNLLSERTGEQQLQTDLSKFYRPITETQKATTREITEELKPIKEGIENLPQAITFPAYPSIETFGEKKNKKIEGEDTEFIGKVALNALETYFKKR